MKKLFCIIAILSLFGVFLYSNELEEKKIMPKKLYYNELPEGYPKELEDLFRFYYEYATELFNSGIPPEDVSSYFHNYIDTLSIKKKLSFCYLDWLALNYMPLYYREYLKINTNFTHEKFVPSEEVSKLSIIPLNDKTLVKGGYQKFLQPLAVRNFLIENINRSYPELNIITNAFSPMWVRATIIDAKMIELEPNLSSSYNERVFATVRINDALGNAIPQKEIIISAAYKGQVKYANKSMLPLETGKEYFMPLTVFTDSRENKDIIYKNITLKTHGLSYKTILDCCYPVNEQDEVVNRFHSNNFTSLLVFAENIRWEEYYQGLQKRHYRPDYSSIMDKRSYASIKDEITGSIELVKSNYERWGL